jgi:hypothetical protein
MPGFVEASLPSIHPVFASGRGVSARSSGRLSSRPPEEACRAPAPIIIVMMTIIVVGIFARHHCGFRASSSRHCVVVVGVEASLAGP